MYIIIRYHIFEIILVIALYFYTRENIKNWSLKAVISIRYASISLNTNFDMVIEIIKFTNNLNDKIYWRLYDLISSRFYMRSVFLDLRL